MNEGKTIYDCGCSRVKVKLGKCDLYDANGNPRPEVTDESKLCRSAVLDMAFQFGARAHEAQLAANKLREDDVSSYVEHEAIATTWSCASALLSELAGGEPSEVEPLHPIIVGEMLWEHMNERRCALITKDVHENGLSPENKTELAGLEAVLDARCALITALERLTPKGLDTLTTAFADAVCNRQTPLDIETRRMLVDAIQDLSRKNMLGRLTYAEEALLARCINRLERDPMRESFVPNVPANECSSAERTQYELTIEQQKERIAELEKQLADELDNPMTTEIESDDVKKVIADRDELLARVANLEESTKQAWSERDHFQARANEDPTKALVIRIEAERDEAQTKARELEARIAELTKVPVVDGQTPAPEGVTIVVKVPHHQTPGQLAKTTFMRATYNAHESEGVDRWALVASEVLRVFGNGGVALQRVRDALDANDVSVGGEHRAVLYPVWTRIIDEELAALAPAKSPATP